MQLTLTLTDETAAWLRARARELNLTPEELMVRHFEKLATLDKINDGRAALQSYAERAGFHTVEDIYNQIS